MFLQDITRATTNIMEWIINIFYSYSKNFKQFSWDVPWNILTSNLCFEGKIGKWICQNKTCLSDIIHIFYSQKYFQRLLFFSIVEEEELDETKFEEQKAGEKLNERKWVWSCYHISALKCRMELARHNNIFQNSFQKKVILHNTPIYL